MAKKTSLKNQHNFISEGYLFLSNLSVDFPKKKWVKISPFLEIKVDKWHGETSGPSLSFFIRSFKARLYTTFKKSILNKIEDINNHSQTQKFIKPFLELYLLSYSLICGESVQFSFSKTLPIKNKKMPHGTKPLPIGDSEYPIRLWSNQELIFNGRATQNSFLERGLSLGEDLSNPRFTLAKHGSAGAFFERLVDTQGFTNIGKKIVEKIILNKENQIVIKSLDYLRRALTLERMGFYNEAYLNYFRIIEAFAEGYGKPVLRRFLGRSFSLSVDEADSLITTRNKVVAHGSDNLDHLREVGQKEIYKIKEYALKLLREELLSGAGL